MIWSIKENGLHAIDAGVTGAYIQNETKRYKRQLHRQRNRILPLRRAQRRIESQFGIST